jgi:3-phenylpropionate/cinnamic acid dioxygenase small subunit
MTETSPDAIAADVLNREGTYLDDRDWDRWLELYSENSVYWVPAWRDEDTETADPDTEISQIYHDQRRGLEERVMRVRSGLSVTTMPLPRTTHFTSNVVAVRSHDGTLNVRANWMVQVYQPRTARHYTNFGHYELCLAETAARWRIEMKKIHLKNDLIPGLIDFYTL